MIIAEKDLMHYGTPRKSGRYPWGSGGDESTRNRDFLGAVANMKKQGLSETEIARGLGMTTTQLRARKTTAGNQQRQEKINEAQRLADKGMSNTAIGKQMGINESSVRAYLAPGAADKAHILIATADRLKKEVDEKGFIDVGTGVNLSLDVSQTKMNTALAMLQDQGYTIHNVPITQLGTGKSTTLKVLAPPNTTWGDVARNKSDIKQIGVWSEDGGRTDLGLLPPLSISSKRIAVRYAEQGGKDADGVIYVRRGVKDVSIENNRYAQVRIAVDGTHYLKGMAMYNDDMPDGVDLVFNTNKSDTGNKKDAFKPMKETDGVIDKDNPFGAQINRQISVKDSKGKQKVTSAMNIVNEEGNWDAWNRKLSSQILSKQSPELAKGQLDVTYEDRLKEYNNILALTNPAVRKKFLEEFADNADSAAVHLQAAALPKSRYQVILPVQSIKPTEVFAPNFKSGDRVALIRSPHGGTFEIPELIVNNRNREALRLIESGAHDAIGIHPKVAARLSGADFDGDTVLVVPNDHGKIKSTPALEGLKDFDTKASFPAYPGMKHIGNNKQSEMGKITNLIADMSIHGANNSELARAVRHSMVVIDAENHDLDYQGSFRQNGIAELKEKYQGRKNAGASTIITRAGSELRIPERRPARVGEGGPIDKSTGKKVFVETGRTVPVRKRVKDPTTGKVTYVDTGTRKLREQTVKKLSVTDDAHQLSSGAKMETIYADYSNRTKALANEARKEMVNTKTIPYSPSAKAAYSKEVASLNASLNVAKKNRPLERQAQVIANSVVSQKRQANPDMDDEQIKRTKNQALNEARLRTGASRHRIQISQSEWNAIQAGAISNSKLEDILRNADEEQVKSLAMPKTQTLMTSTKHNRAIAMLDQGYTQAETAQALGVSLTTLKNSLNQ